MQAATLPERGRPGVHQPGVHRPGVQRPGVQRSLPRTDRSSKDRRSGGPDAPLSVGRSGADHRPAPAGSARARLVQLRTSEVVQGERAGASAPSGPPGCVAALQKLPVPADGARAAADAANRRGTCQRGPRRGYLSPVDGAEHRGQSLRPGVPCPHRRGLRCGHSSGVLRPLRRGVLRLRRHGRGFHRVNRGDQRAERRAEPGRVGSATG